MQCSTLHIPAWKRLGLQLKNAPASTTADVSHKVAVEPAQKKRKLINGESNATVAQKGVVSNNVTHAFSELPGSKPSHIAGQVLNSNPNNSIIELNDQTSIHKRVKRKSVTFTSEAKVVDGPEDPIIYPTSEETKYAIAESDAKLVKKEKRKLRRDKSASSINSTTPSHQNDLNNPPEDRPPYLNYLDCYHNQRNIWKFSKALQTHVLKNSFHIDRVPPSYDQALFAYVAGLQGQAARSRLKESAQAILDDPDPNLTPQQNVVKFPGTAEMENPAAQKQALQAARKEDARKVKRALEDEQLGLIEQSPEHKLKLARRLRAENIILALADQPGDSGPNQPESMLHDRGQTQIYDKKLRRTSRGRKWRTTSGVPDDNEISSSSSSSSEEPSADESSSQDESDDSSEDEEDSEDGEGSSDGEDESPGSTSSDTVGAGGTAHEAIEGS